MWRGSITPENMDQLKVLTHSEQQQVINAWICDEESENLETKCFPGFLCDINIALR